MPVILGETPVMTFEGYPPRKKWTREEVETFEKSGAWDGQHYELVQGDLINKMGKHLAHILANKRLFLALAGAFGWDFVLPEAPFCVAPEDYPTSDPEPDVIVLGRDPRGIKTTEPEADDVVLVAEVADTTLRFDLSIKAALYARAHVPEYWVLDLRGRLVVHRDPQAGHYQSIISYSGEERVSPLAAPDKFISVGELLG
jgi:Uma2 family endonuclease